MEYPLQELLDDVSYGIVEIISESRQKKIYLKKNKIKFNPNKNMREAWKQIHRHTLQW
jgi:1,2-phenylacetyl-CoA epoxidase catalytic subunit